MPIYRSCRLRACVIMLRWAEPSEVSITCLPTRVRYLLADIGRVVSNCLRSKVVRNLSAHVASLGMENARLSSHAARLEALRAPLPQSDGAATVAVAGRSSKSLLAAASQHATGSTASSAPPSEQQPQLPAPLLRRGRGKGLFFPSRAALPCSSSSSSNAGNKGSASSASLPPPSSSSVV